MRGKDLHHLRHTSSPAESEKRSAIWRHASPASPAGREDYFAPELIASKGARLDGSDGSDGFDMLSLCQATTWRCRPQLPIRSEGFGNSELSSESDPFEQSDGSAQSVAALPTLPALRALTTIIWQLKTRLTCGRSEVQSRVSIGRRPAGRLRWIGGPWGF